MTAAVQDALIEAPAPVVLSRDESRAAVAIAINACALLHERRVHASMVRPFLPAGVARGQVGSVFNTLWAKEILVPAHCAPRKSGGGSGNANKWLPVWRLARPVTREDVA